MKLSKTVGVAAVAGLFGAAALVGTARPAQADYLHVGGRGFSLGIGTGRAYGAPAYPYYPAYAYPYPAYPAYPYGAYSYAYPTYGPYATFGFGWGGGSGGWHGGNGGWHGGRGYSGHASHGGGGHRR